MHVRHLLVILALVSVLAAQDPGAGRDYADLQRAGQLIEAGKNRAAEKLLEGLAEALPDSSAVWFQLALARSLQGRRQTAVVAIRRAVELDGAHFDALVLAAELMASTDREKARAHARAAAKLAGDDRALVRRVIEVLIAVQDIPAALPVLQRALTAHPADESLLRLKAELALEGDEPKKAVEAYEALSRLNPRDPTVVESLARVLVALDKKPDAVKAFERCLKINPSNVHARATLIDLLKELDADPSRIADHELYLEYYRELRRRVGK